MLLSRAALLSLGLSLGWLPSTAIHAVSVAAKHLDDNKAFEAIAQKATSIPSTAFNLPTHSGITLMRSPDGLFYARARVNDQLIRFVVDTGSSMVVLTGQDATLLGLGTSAHNAKRLMQTAGGSVSAHTASLHHVKIGNRAVQNVDAVIVRNGLPTSLLGQNLLSRLGPITIEGNELSLK